VDSEQSLLVDDVIVVLSRNRINVAFAFSRNLTTVAQELPNRCSDGRLCTAEGEDGLNVTFYKGE